MGKRTQKQIELDCKRIQEAAKTAKTFKEIGEMTGLSHSEIRTSLSKHPRISKKVQKQVEDNKVASENEMTEKEKSQDVAKNSEAKTPEKEKENVHEHKEDADYDMGFVIDTSMLEVNAIRHMLYEICETDAKIILTSVVRQELNGIQFYKKDYKAKRARLIMSIAAEQPENFRNVVIDETLTTHDDCIVKYCAENKERVILLTADKNMVLDAREKHVKVEFFRQGTQQIKSLNHIMVPKKEEGDVRTLNPAKRIHNKLIIMEMQNKKRCIYVVSDGKAFTDGIVELKIGDDVYIAAKKNNSMTFAHYQMITLYEENNCKQVFFQKICSYEEIQNLPQDSYKEFAMDFWNKNILKK